MLDNDRHPDGEGNLVRRRRRRPRSNPLTGRSRSRSSRALFASRSTVNADLANAIRLRTAGDRPHAVARSRRGGRQVPGVQEQLFLAPPPDQDDAFYAALYAAARSHPAQYACEQMLSWRRVAARGGGDIVSPSPGQKSPPARRYQRPRDVHAGAGRVLRSRFAAGSSRTSKRSAIFIASVANGAGTHRAVLQPGSTCSSL